MERSGMRRQKIEYPYLRYLSVLLAVALLLTGVTFAGYRWEWNGLRSVGIGGFDCSYEIESVNSSVFTDRDYWVEYAGQWTDLGANDGRTVRFTLENNGGTAVQSTFRMYGPEEFWSNLALQLVREYPSGSDAVLTPQIVLADLIYEGEKEESGYRMKYGAYRAWGGTGSFFTGDSVDYGALGEGEAALSVTGGVDETGGALSAKWAGGSVSIEKSFRTERYAVGFERETPAGNTASVLYLDLEKENVPYYAVSLSLPAMLLQPGERATYVLYLTWTNAVELKGVGKAWPGLPAAGESFNDSACVGYHYSALAEICDASGAPQGETTYVRVNRAFGGETAYEHLARLKEEDSSFAHPIAIADADRMIGKCANADNPVYMLLSGLDADPSQGYEIGFSIEKSYTTRFNVLFEQANARPEVSA